MGQIETQPYVIHFGDFTVTSRRLRTSDTFTFAVQRTGTRLGDRSFAVAGPQIWNSLRLVDNSYYTRFRRLKGRMFG